MSTTPHAGDAYANGNGAGLQTPLHERPVVMCVGNDAALLTYRAEVLKLAGFQVATVCPAPWQREHLAQLCNQHRPAITLACHSLTREQRIALATQVRAECPATRLLALTAGHMGAEEAASYDTLLDSLEGPAALIEMLIAQL